MTSVAQPNSNTASSEAFNEFEAGDYVVLQHKDDQEVIPGDFSTTSPCPPPSAPSIPTVTEAPAEAPAPAAPAPTVEQQQVPAKSKEEQEEAEAEAEEEEGDDEDGELESNEVSVDDSAIESSDSEAFEAEIAQFEASESSADRSEANSPEPQPEDSANPSVQVAGARSKPMSAESMLFVGGVLIMLMAFLLYRWIPTATPTPAQFQYYEDDDFAGSYSVHPPGRY